MNFIKSILKNKWVLYIVVLLVFLGVKSVLASSGHEDSGASHGGYGSTFMWIAVILIVAKLSGLVEKFGQPGVLGELVAGVILGNLVLLGIHTFEPVKDNSVITFLAELGVVILLFQVGLESNIQQMKSVGVRAGLVAIIGVVVPFVLGTYIVGPWLMPDLSSNAYLFLGAALTATSVGITARVFKDLGKLHLPEAQIVLGAAVIDDVLGLIILAVVSAVVTVGAVSLGVISWIVAKAVLFLVGAVVLGRVMAPGLGRILAKVNTGQGMKLTLALAFGLLFAFAAEEIGLAPIVGAFAAGLVLDPVHFGSFKDPEYIVEVKENLRGIVPSVQAKISKVLAYYSHRHVEDLIEPIAHLLVPIFFIVTGMSVKLETLFNVPILLVALGITVLAFVGKLVSGVVAGSVNKQLVGWGMVPRGEVGLIFATIGKGLGVVSDEVFSVIVIMVILTTLITPPVLSAILKKQDI